MPLYFLTGSKKKFEEARTLLPSLEQLSMDLPEIQDIDAHAIVREKLNEGARRHDGALIVEDTSLYFDGLNGLPGPLVKWFIQTVGAKGLYTVAAAFSNFNAEAKTIIGYRAVSGEIQFFEGSVRGIIVEPRGPDNFGWDPIFMPEGSAKTFAEMSAEEKNAISHRGIAMRKLRDALSGSN